MFLSHYIENAVTAVKESLFSIERQYFILYLCLTCFATKGQREHYSCDRSETHCNGNYIECWNSCTSGCAYRTLSHIVVFYINLITHIPYSAFIAAYCSMIAKLNIKQYSRAQNNSVECASHMYVNFKLFMFTQVYRWYSQRCLKNIQNEKYIPKRRYMLNCGFKSKIIRIELSFPFLYFNDKRCEIQKEIVE